MRRFKHDYFRLIKMSQPRLSDGKKNFPSYCQFSAGVLRKCLLEKRKCITVIALPDQNLGRLQAKCGCPLWGANFEPPRGLVGVFQRGRKVAEDEFLLNLTVYRTSRCLRLAPATATDQHDTNCYGAPE